MNYQKHYDALIERARTRQLPEDLYVERHHIQPRCIGGSDDDSNLVNLTAEEHYVAHQLLVKMYSEHQGLVYAANMLACNNDRQNRQNNKSYGWIKRKLSEARIGQKHTKEARRKMSHALIGNTRTLGMKHTEESKRKMRLAKANVSEETRQKISNANRGKVRSEALKKQISEKLKGRKHTQKSIDKMKKSQKGHKVSEETKRKISMTKRNKPKLPCPHCGKVTRSKRWHFNNCKMKN